MSHHIKGIVTVATVAIGFSAMAITAWMGWVSTTTIKNVSNVAAIYQWQKDYGAKIDTLLQRNGVDPLIFKNVQTTPQN